MMVARVLGKINASETQNNTRPGRRLIVNEMDVSIRQLTGLPFTADDAVGAAEGDLILCSANGGRLTAVGIIDTIKLVGTNVYVRVSGQQMSGETLSKAMTQQEEK